MIASQFPLSVKQKWRAEDQMLVKASNVTWHIMSPQKQMGLEMTRAVKLFPCKHKVGQQNMLKQTGTWWLAL